MKKWIIGFAVGFGLMAAALCAFAEECVPNDDCNSLVRTPTYGFPHMGKRLCHPEKCYNELLRMVDELMACTTTSTTSTTVTTTSSTT